MGIPETAMNCPKSTKKAEAFSDLMLSNGLRFVNGRSKSEGAAKATFDNGRSQSVIDYVIVNVEAWPAVLGNQCSPGGEHSTAVLVFCRSVSIILEIYARKAVAATLYGVELWGFRNVKGLQVAENNFLRTLLGLGPGTPLKALYAELNLKPIAELAAIRPILYWARVVRNPRTAVYFETLEEVISYDGSGGCSWGAYVKKTLENLQLKHLWVDLGRVTKDTVGQIKHRYWELSKMRVHKKLRPDSVMHYYINNVYDPAPKA
ncbi:hypothetical protein NDU88_003484 [Pleurodeles waltl]|uniref:Uncharacterized protein n=1 Tax=Pleurodeles waltl TaxID=8319 RepID=A0AAV7Q9I7_PLEWA|nr:hypothetical protein NDU88_003484 [Pleurodeles waltl]